jgi:putative transposase
MPRSARITAPGLVYHVTHRGNRRGDVFFDREDREFYLRWLAGAARRHAIEVWAYCLMTNHVHLLVKGLRHDSLGLAMRELQGRYARRINDSRKWSGHLWANRFYSHPVGGDHLWAVARYIERNPVRADMVARAEDYAWSSARAHCGVEGPGILSPGRPFPGRVGDWKSWLEVGDEATDMELRDACRTGRPAGGPEFVTQLESQVGRALTPRPRGRPRKTALEFDDVDLLGGEAPR